VCRPNVAVYDLVIHPRDGDLIAGTHGRAVWILDDLTPLRQMTPVMAERCAGRRTRGPLARRIVERR